MSKRKTTEQFIKEAIAIHGEIYDYSRVDYKNKYSKITIGCKKHGWFEQIPNNHLRGAICAHCGIDNRSKHYSKGTEKFIKDSIDKFGIDKFDYSKVNYINNKSNILLLCKKHNIEFKITPKSHLGTANKTTNGGCPKCFSELVSKRYLKSREDYIAEANEIHNNLYDYSKVNYINSKDAIDIICPIHGVFSQEANSHLRGVGCPTCGFIRSGLYGGYRKEDWINNSKKSKNFDTYKLYKIKCYNDSEVFFKIGITFVDISLRFYSSALPYNYEIVEVIESDNGEYIWDLEKELHRTHNEFKYTPKLKFGGMTECFTKLIKSNYEGETI